MWFTLNLGPALLQQNPGSNIFYTILSAVVGGDGKLYWRLADVAKLAGNGSTQAFPDRFTLRGKDVIKRGDATGNTMRCRVATTKQVYTWLRAHNLLTATLFHKSLVNGRCVAHMGSPSSRGRFQSWCAYAPILTLDDTGDTHIPTWIQEFTTDIMDMRAVNRQDLNGK